MSQAADPHKSVHQIRRRLLGLLLQAFGLVVLLTVVLLLGLFMWAVRQDFFLRPPANRVLEGYYLGRGSWEGVGAVVPLVDDDERASDRLWQSLILLDEGGRVLLDHGRADSERVGQWYSPVEGEWRFPLRAHGAQVGTLVLALDQPLLEPLVLAAGVLVPVVALSLPLGALTLLIGFLLAQRFINPLADVIAAARAVADGTLSTRVPVRGPGDLRALTDSFNHMADALERSDRERRAMLTDIAHELRTPLTVMRGRLEGIVDGVYPADVAHIAPVLEETYTLERLVDDLRTLTLAEARQLHFDLRPVDLGELAERAASLFDAEAQEKRVALAVKIEAGLECVSADPQRLAQVIGNLLSNALRYAPEGGRIELLVRRVTDGVELCVADDGPGVPEADLPRIFDRFWRGDKARTRATGGAGLGLAIARQLVEAQGGALSAHNNSAGGLSVSLVLR
jgi:two-component system OmpR family sensor kinase/two-component system sensor histidine kinase BaeS